MAKRILQDPVVMNYISKTFTNTEDDYRVGNNEWADGTRSDVVLEAKAASLPLPPIIVEIQHTVNHLFMKRAVNYCLQAYKRYKVDPILLVICVDRVHVDITQRVAASRFPGCDSFPCYPWAANCVIVSRESLAGSTTPLHPLVALGLFFSNSSLQMDSRFEGDSTMQHLYTLAASYERQHHKNITLPLLQSQSEEYERLLSLAHSLGSPDVLIQAINRGFQQI